MFVDPSVDADFVAAAPEDFGDHLRMQKVADGRNEERCRNLVLVEQPRTGHAVGCAVLAA
jgi:hypothetical protein